jgi:hypothetical protein
MEKGLGPGTARERRPGTPTLRSTARGRIVLGALALTVLGILAWIFALNGGQDEGKPHGPAPVQPKPTVEASSNGLGLSYRYPRDWRRDTKHGVVRLISPGRSVGVAIASPTRGDAVDVVFNDLRRQIKGSYRNVHVAKTSSRARFAGNPARKINAFGTNEKGERVSILGVVGAGRSRTYLIQVFSSTHTELVRIREANAIIHSFRFISGKKG